MDLVVSALLSAVYFLTIPWHPFPGSFVIKAASVAILSYVALRKRAPGLATALAFSAAGDALLEYSPNLFVAGLLAFLCAQITYAVIFLRNRRSKWFSPAIVAVVVYSIGLAAWLLPAVSPALAVPVTIYVAAITTMVVAAFATNSPDRWIPIGAVLFLVSDSVLAINRFRVPLEWSGWVVWSTYYVAQFLMTSGYLKALGRASEARPITAVKSLHATR